jgi:hypothetical protein
MLIPRNQKVNLKRPNQSGILFPVKSFAQTNAACCCRLQKTARGRGVLFG